MSWIASESNCKAKYRGKQGRTADALRTILSAVSAKAKKRTALEIMD